MTPSDLISILSTGRFPLVSEKRTQAAIERHLLAQIPQIRFTREHRLSSADIPDFMVDGIALEVKLRSAKAPDILAQLERYAAHDEVRFIVLATNKAIHLPAEIGGKAALYHSLGNSWL